MIMATHTGHVMNLANSIIGVSLLAMPFCFKQCGITLAIVMLILSSIISRLACHFLVKSSTMCRRRNFEFLAFYTFGPSGKLLVELGVIGFMMGTCVAFFVVMGDLGPAIISKLFNISNNSTLRTSVLIGLGLLVILPLGLLRNVESLAAVSTITIGFYFLFIIKIFFESSPRLINGDWWYHVNFWQPEGILQCIPIFAMALSCQTQLFEIYESLPTPTIEKMNSVVHSALNLCTIVYASVGFLGYIAYCKGTFTGNILLSFAPSFSSEMFKLGFVLSIAVSFPLVIFPCRASLFSLIYKKMPIHHELSQTSSHIPDSRFKFLTIGIISVALITGLLIPSIELVLGFVGSTIGIAICVIFPSLSFLNLNNKNTNERLVAKLTLFMGLIIMIMGTFGNLFAAVENKAMEPPSAKLGLGDSRSLPQLKIPPVVEVSTQFPKKTNKEVLLVNPISPEKMFPLKLVDGTKPKAILEKERRKEPPIPVAPEPSKKEKRPQVEVIENKKEMKESKSLAIKPKIEEKKLEVKANEAINKDAIEKEERELLEAEKQKKVEEDEKQQELLKRLKEHQDEQKKLLQEQEKILKEIKHREIKKKTNEGKADVKNVIAVDEVKTIKADEFKVNINEIQNILENLKDTKSALEKDKIASEPKNPPALNISTGKEELAEIKQEKKIEPLLKKVERETDGVKRPVESAPLPLAKFNVQESKKSEVPKISKSKQELLGRDILVDIKVREKRDLEEKASYRLAECPNREKLAGSIPSEDKTELEPPISIKNSEHLSVDLPDHEKPKITDETSKIVSNILSQPLISKKRDLKSVAQPAFLP